MIYDKKTFSIQEHIQQLIDRGMLIADEELAKHYLSQVSYYRLAGYWWPMQSDKVEHKLKELFKKYPSVDLNALGMNLIGKKNLYGNNYENTKNRTHSCS